MTKPPFFRPMRVQHPDLNLPVKYPQGGDECNEGTYVYHDPKIELAVNVALATRRPLLLSGASGSGKSILAFNVAATLRWRYYKFVVTPRSEVGDLFWRHDPVQRLADAQAGSLGPNAKYLEPGPLWWAMAPDLARRRGGSEDEDRIEEATDPSAITVGSSENSVVLIDEIDKADPDFPNSLLVPLGALEFNVAPVRKTILGKLSPLILITTNGERELPQAFIRRCVSLELPSPDEERLVEIAMALIAKQNRDEELFREMAQHVVRLAKESDQPVPPSTAEYLDALRACIALKIDTEHPDFKTLSSITLEKASIRGQGSWV